jgi:cold shock CspA family protein
MRELGQIKWYDPAKKWGFVIGSDGKDVFLHGSVVQLCGLTPDQLLPDSKVKFSLSERPRAAGRHPEISCIAPA